MSQSFANADGLPVVKELIATIHANRDYLSEIDGKIGDGDHGINMDKGFQLAGERLEADMSMAEGLITLGRTLLLEIGGSMGPLYGQFFKAMGRSVRDMERIDGLAIVTMLEEGQSAIGELGEAKPGDKTLIDTLEPAVGALRESIAEGQEVVPALDKMMAAAEEGWKSTEDMVAKVGRSSRLGERSRGVLDAGATSCYLLLQSFSTSVRPLLEN